MHRVWLQVEGEPLTIVSFSASIWDAEVAPFPQHLMLFANVANASADAPMYQAWARGYAHLTLPPSGAPPARVQRVPLTGPLRVDTNEEESRNYWIARHKLVRPRWPGQ